MTTTPTSSFRYHAQSPTGTALAGTIEAPSAADAQSQLASLGLRVFSIDPASPDTPRARQRPLAHDDFQAFNEQLAHLASAGLPVEQGLRLIAKDLRAGRLATVANELADDLHRGISLPEAFARHKDRFPPLYHHLIQAGIQSANLPAVLLNLGRHLDLLARMREALFRALAYPLAVFVGLLAIFVFLSIYIIPIFPSIFGEFRMKIPLITTVFLAIGQWVPILALALALGILFLFILYKALRRTAAGRATLEAILFPLPLFGPMLRRNITARWCDAARIAVDAGLSLPSAFTMAAQTLASPAAERESAALVEHLNAGRPLDSAPTGKIITAAIPAAIDLASRVNDLPAALASLAAMYQQQAEAKLRLIPTVVTPLLMAAIAVVIAFTAAALLLPLLHLIRSVSGGM